VNRRYGIWNRIFNTHLWLALLKGKKPSNPIRNCRNPDPDPNPKFIPLASYLRLTTAVSNGRQMISPEH